MSPDTGPGTVNQTSMDRKGIASPAPGTTTCRHQDHHASGIIGGGSRE